MVTSYWHNAYSLLKGKFIPCLKFFQTDDVITAECMTT